MNNILITQRIIEHSAYPETREALDVQWGAFFSKFENVTLIPILTQSPIEKYLSLDPKGVIISGGNDLEGNSLADRIRKEHNIELIRFSRDNRIPLLGICYGMQLINEYFGGTLKKCNVPRHVKVKHLIDIHSNFFQAYYGGKINVNSFHQYNIDSLGADFIVDASCSEHEIEAISHRDEHIKGIMWHPERCVPFAPEDQVFINAFFNI